MSVEGKPDETPENVDIEELDLTKLEEEIPETYLPWTPSFRELSAVGHDRHPPIRNPIATISTTSDEKEQLPIKEADFTKEQGVPPPSPTPESIPTRDFDEKKHRAVTAEKAVWALFGLLYLIAGGAFILLWHGTPVHEIELLIFALLALVGIIAGPLLGFFFGERHAG